MPSVAAEFDIDALISFHKDSISRLENYKKLLDSTTKRWFLTSWRGSMLHYITADGHKSVCGNKIDITNTLLQVDATKKKCSMCCSILRDKGIDPNAHA